MTIRIGLVGAGLVGSRRAATAAESGGSRLVVVADQDQERARRLAETYGSRFTGDWQSVVASTEVDAVVVSTSNKFLAPISVAALQANKHVLCEKPMARNGREAAEMAAAARASGQVLKVGFTLRFHPALREAHRLCALGEIGPLFFVRAIYGHGGRPGYAQEWRGNPDLAGGGELLDQGVHLLDLASWFLGPFDEIKAKTACWFWGVEPLEDNAFLLLGNGTGQVASLHASWTEWRNQFRFDVFGRDGYVRIGGLGGSYGPETLIVGKRRDESGPPGERRRVFDEADRSWQDDWIDFLDAIERGRPPEVAGEQALKTMETIDAIYRHAGRVLV